MYDLMTIVDPSNRDSQQTPGQRILTPTFAILQMFYNRKLHHTQGANNQYLLAW